MNCINCSAETKNPKFCSRSCATSLNNRLTPKRVWTCKRCNTQNNRKSRNSRLCVSCYSPKIHKDYTLLEVRRRYRHTREKHNLVNNRARSALIKAGRVSCEWEGCSWSFSFQAAHIKSSSSFSDSTLVSEVNRLDNLLALCPNHHWYLDHIYLRSTTESIPVFETDDAGAIPAGGATLTDSTTVSTLS